MLHDGLIDGLLSINVQDDVAYIEIHDKACAEIVFQAQISHKDLLQALARRCDAPFEYKFLNTKIAGKKLVLEKFMFEFYCSEQYGNAVIEAAKKRLLEILPVDCIPDLHELEYATKHAIKEIEFRQATSDYLFKAAITIRKYVEEEKT